VKRVFALGGLLLLSGPAAIAGNMDSHLTATHFIARDVDLSESDARTIAAADWSMDLNERTEALPDVTLEAFESAGFIHPPKGYSYHSLADSPEEVRDRLVKMRAVILGDMDHETKMRHVGQYLHALQDVYFHTDEDGAPYGPMVGHLLGGHGTDKVALHFDAALRAYRESREVLKAIAVGDPIPPPPPIDRLYHLKQITRVELDAARSDGTLALASAIARSYEVVDRSPAPRDVQEGVYWNGKAAPALTDPNLETLSTSLLALSKKGATFVPFVELKAGDPEALDYNEHPEWLVLQLDEHYVSPIHELRAKGVSFTAAAAEALPLGMDLESVRFRNGELVLGGPDGGTLDSALFLTAMRLACRREDPYFSLDPVDGPGFVTAAIAAFDGFGKFESQLVPVLALEPAEDSDASNVGIPEQRIWSIRELDRKRYEAARSNPALQVKLVFRPAWLRETRFGARMYAADVALKAMAAGINDVETDHTAGTTAGLPPNTPPGILRMAARAIVEPDSIALSRDGSRLWFDLPAPRTASVWDFTIPELPDFSGAQAPRTVGDAIRERLREKDLVGGGHLDGLGATAAVHDGTVDLSALVPVAHVVLHDMNSGADRAGTDPSLADLAAELNRRFPEFAVEQPSLTELRDVLRAYVAAVHVTGQKPELCEDVERIPLLASERVAATLPSTRPPLTVVASVTVPIAYTGDDGTRHGTTDHGIAGIVSGGVTLGGRESLAAGAATAVTAAFEEGVAARAGRGVWSSGERRFVAMRMDTHEGAELFASVARFIPVTEEDVMSGRAPVAAIAGVFAKKSLLASRWFPGLVTLAFLALANATAILVYRRMRRV
jgi:hypothetical protein